MIRLRPYPLWILASISACISACGGPTPTNTPEPEIPEPTPRAQDGAAGDQEATGPAKEAANDGDNAQGLGVPPGIDTSSPPRAVPPGIQCGPTEFVAGAACFADANAACQSLSCAQGCVTLETAPAQVRCK